jgi:pimeloyl-ACP methyl ester carboxylesterase
VKYNPYYDQVEFQQHKYEDQPTLRLLDWGLERLRQTISSMQPDHLREALRRLLLATVETDLAELELDLRVRRTFSQGQCDGFDLTLDIGGIIDARATLLFPHHRRQGSPVFLCLHGHQHEGRQWTVSAGPAAALTRAGYACLCPDLPGLGESRGATENGARGNITYDLLVHNALLLGWTLNGLRLWILEKWIQEVTAHTLFNQRIDSLACAGFSLGGELALYLGALHSEIEPVYISDYACSWQASYWSKLHCRCAYVPGLMRIADLVDVYRLIAPRALALEVSRYDRSFPWQDTQQLLTQVSRCYDELSARPRFHHVVKESDHAFHCAPQTLAFLEKMMVLDGKDPSLRGQKPQL